MVWPTRKQEENVEYCPKEWRGTNELEQVGAISGLAIRTIGDFIRWIRYKPTLLVGAS